MGIEVDSPCGPGAPCRARLEAMEVAHHKALQELQEKHEKEIRELEEQRDRMLQDKSEATAKGTLVTMWGGREGAVWSKLGKRNIIIKKKEWLKF